MTSIRFSGTHVFRLDRAINREESQVIANALLQGTSSTAQAALCSGYTSELDLTHQFALQGNDEADDQVLLSNAQRLGIELDSIKSTRLNFLPLDPDTLESYLFTEWTTKKGVLLNPANSVADLLQKARQ